MNQKQRLTAAGALIAPIGMALKMGMDFDVLEKMLKMSMESASEASKKSGASKLSKTLEGAFDKLQHAHGGFHEFFYATKKTMANQGVQLYGYKARAMNIEREWREQTPEMVATLSKLNDATKKSAGYLTEVTKSEVRELAALEFVKETQYNAPRKALKMA